MQETTETTSRKMTATEAAAEALRQAKNRHVHVKVEDRTEKRAALAKLLAQSNLPGDLIDGADTKDGPTFHWNGYTIVPFSSIFQMKGPGLSYNQPFYKVDGLIAALAKASDKLQADSEGPHPVAPTDMVMDLVYRDGDNATYSVGPDERAAVESLWSHFASGSNPAEITIRPMVEGEELDG